MAAFVDLEISLRRKEAGVYAVEMGLIYPGSESESRWGQREDLTFTTDIDALKLLRHDPEEYGKRLTKEFFYDPELKSAYKQAQSIAKREKIPLKVRLYITKSVNELQGVYWEMLRDPEDGSLLFIGDQVLFSRYCQ